jgi:hypothetical protein
MVGQGGETLVLSAKYGKKQQQLRTASGFIAAVACACVMVAAFDVVMRTSPIDVLLAKSRIPAAQIKMAHVQSLNATGEGGSSDGYVKDANVEGLTTVSVVVYVCGAVRLPNPPYWSPSALQHSHKIYCVSNEQPLVLFVMGTAKTEIDVIDLPPLPRVVVALLQCYCFCRYLFIFPSMQSSLPYCMPMALFPFVELQN